MKNFFVRITELFTTVSLAGVLMFFLFKFIIGSPEDLKQVHVDLRGVSSSIDSLKKTNSFMLERMMVIEERQVDQYQKLDETEKILKQNGNELSKLRKIYGKLVQPIYYKKTELESDSLILERYKERK